MTAEPGRRAPWVLALVWTAIILIFIGIAVPVALVITDRFAEHTVTCTVIEQGIERPCDTPVSDAGTATAMATPTAGATATAAASQRTGIGAVDAVIAAVEARDIGALVALLRYTNVACVATPEGLSGDPPCDGAPEGTLVETVPMASCEGGYVPAALARDALNGVLTGRPLTDTDVYAVYRTAGSGLASSLFSRADLEYAVVLGTDAGDRIDAWALLVGGSGIVGLENGCAETPETFVETWRLTDAVLSPPAQ